MLGIRSINLLGRRIASSSSSSGITRAALRSPSLHHNGLMRSTQMKQFQQQRTIILRQNQAGGSCRFCDVTKSVCNVFATPFRYTAASVRWYSSLRLKDKLGFGFSVTLITVLYGGILYATDCFSLYEISRPINAAYLFGYKLLFKTYRLGTNTLSDVKLWWDKLEDDSAWPNIKDNKDLALSSDEDDDEEWIKATIKAYSTYRAHRLFTSSDKHTVVAQWLEEKVFEYNTERAGHKVMRFNRERGAAQTALKYIGELRGWTKDEEMTALEIALKYIHTCLPSEGAGMMTIVTPKRKRVKKAQETLDEIKRAMKTTYFQEAIYGQVLIEKVEEESAAAALTEADDTIAKIQYLEKEVQQLKDTKDKGSITDPDGSMQHQSIQERDNNKRTRGWFW